MSALAESGQRRFRIHFASNGSTPCSSPWALALTFSTRSPAWRFNVPCRCPHGNSETGIRVPGKISETCRHERREGGPCPATIAAPPACQSILTRIIRSLSFKNRIINGISKMNHSEQSFLPNYILYRQQIIPRRLNIYRFEGQPTILFPHPLCIFPLLPEQSTP